MEDASETLRSLLGLAPPTTVAFRRAEPAAGDGYRRSTLTYSGREGDSIPAVLFVPDAAPPVPGAVVFHQHAGEFHLGKSEVAGDIGDPCQAFGPALARRGVAVLAPDAITFEDRRAHTEGVEPDDEDWLQHYNALAYRLLNGDILMRKCLDDAQRALSVLMDQPEVDATRVGVCGHSYGGSTALYHAAVDPRCRFACSSGALASLAARQRAGTGINMFEVVPGLATTLDLDDLLRAIAPRPTFVVSATNDPYSADADEVVARANVGSVHELRVDGEHALDATRFDAIVDWVARTAAAAGSQAGGH